MEIMRQSEQWPDQVDRCRVATGTPHNALGDGEFFYNRDPAMGHTVPNFVGGDPSGAVPIMPPAEAGDGARRMEPEETGLEYPVIARPSGHGNGFDVLKPLG